MDFSAADRAGRAGLAIEFSFSRLLYPVCHDIFLRCDFDNFAFVEIL